MLDANLSQQLVRDIIAETDGAQFFSQEAIDWAIAETGQEKSLKTIAVVPTRFFVDMMPAAEADPTSTERVNHVMRSGGTFSSLPVLFFENEGNGVGQVVAHDGRHRIQALLERGVEVVPVILVSREGGHGRAIRWGRISAGERPRVFPTMLRGEGKCPATDMQPLPDSVVFPWRANLADEQRQSPRVSGSPSPSFGPI